MYWVEMEDETARMVEEDERVRIERPSLPKKDERMYDTNEVVISPKS